MTNSGDNGPLAPRRSLGKPGNPQAPEPQQPRHAMNTSQTGAATQAYTPADAETGQTFPVPPAPAGQHAQGGHQAQAGPQAPARSAAGTTGGPNPGQTKTRDRTAEKAERAAEKASRRAAANRPRQTRRAKLRLTRIDPWSVTKTAFLLSIAFGIMCVVAVFLIFSIMSAAGLWDHVNETIQGVINARPEDAFDIKEYVGMSRVMGITMLIAAVDVVLITALATLGAFIYNMSASMLGGVELTLAEDLK